MTKGKIALRSTKWLAVALIVINFVASQSGKVFQMLHLKSIGFEMVSISPLMVISGIIGSLAILTLVFIDRMVYKHKLKSPFQILALLAGIMGLIYYVILGLLIVL